MQEKSQVNVEVPWLGYDTDKKKYTNAFTGDYN